MRGIHHRSVTSIKPEVILSRAIVKTQLANQFARSKGTTFKKNADLDLHSVLNNVFGMNSSVVENVRWNTGNPDTP